MTTVYNRQMLAAEALSNLFSDGGTGQSPASEDVEFVDSRIDALLAELSARNIVSVADADDILPEYFSPLAALLANECASKFGQQKSPIVKDEAEERLLIMTHAGVLRELKTDRIMRQGTLRVGRYPSVLG